MNNMYYNINIEKNKEDQQMADTTKVNAIDVKMINKFHRGLCPQCTGKCAMGYKCEYDFTNKKEPKPEINVCWENYVGRVSERISEWGWNLERAYEVLVSDDATLSEDEMKAKWELTSMF